MIKSLSYKFTDLLVKNEVVENEDYEIYRYGFETLIYFIVNISVALFIGTIFDRFIHTIIFLSCYCTLRQFTGGYHARNYTECTLTFVAIYLLTMLIDNNIDIVKYKYLLILFMIGSIFIIYRLAPLEHRNKPLNNDEKKAYKKTAIKIAVVAWSVFTFSMIFNILTTYFIYLLYSIIWICILMIVAYNKPNKAVDVL